MPIVELHIETRDRIDRIVAVAQPELSRSRVAQLIRDGRLTVEGEAILRPSFRVSPGQRVQLEIPDPQPDEAIPQDLPIDIVYEDRDVVVVNKAAGMVVHPSAGHADGTLVNALLHHVSDLSGIGGVLRPGIVHRLDRGTSGLLVVAKNDATHQYLAAQFADHSAERRYLALCYGVPSEATGTVRSTLGRHPTDRIRFASRLEGKPAVTHYAKLAEKGRISLVECVLETGRTHQVRVHLSESGWPIIGDALYFRKKVAIPSTIRDVVPDNRPLLHAWQLQFTHPSGERMSFVAQLPDDFRELIRRLGMSANVPKAIQDDC